MLASLHSRFLRIGREQSERTDGHDGEPRRSHQHPVGDLTRRRRFLAPAGQCREDSYRNRRERYDIERIELLEDRGRNGNRPVQIQIFIIEDSHHARHDAAGNDAASGRLGLKEREESVDPDDDQHEVPHAEKHALETLRALFVELIGEVGQCQPILVESHPEENHHGENEAEGDDTLAHLASRKFFLRHGLLAALALAALDVAEGGAEGVINPH